MALLHGSLQDTCKECNNRQAQQQLFLCMTWLVHMVWHDSFKCVRWLNRMCDMTCSCVCACPHSLQRERAREKTSAREQDKGMETGSEKEQEREIGREGVSDICESVVWCVYSLCTCLYSLGRKRERDRKSRREREPEIKSRVWGGYD